MALWSLSCARGCEDVLRQDPRWAGEVSSVPETPDETRVREDQEKRGIREQSDATAEALQRLGQLGDLPGVLAAFMEYLAAQTGPAAPVPDPRGAAEDTRDDGSDAEAEDTGAGDPRPASARPTGHGLTSFLPRRRG
ncbi:hypothetical protein ACFXPJ_05065 [Streptomyces goshikiensis]